eukprot:scaffold1396_cov73-Phaeocystis_antarctica.AAC.6
MHVFAAAAAGLAASNAAPRPAPAWPAGVRHRARVLYDGEGYSGSQIQPSARTVAGELESALERRYNRPIQVVAAGRTDAGVHARGAAVHFDLPDHLDGGLQLQHSLNALLPPDVRVHAIEAAPELDSTGRPWHAIRWATGKLYSYRLFEGDPLDPLERRQRHQVPRRDGTLDRAAMRKAIGHLLGEVDCAAFANRRSSGAGKEAPPQAWDVSETRRVVRAITLHDEGEGMLRLDVHVKSALYKMVRNIVGLLLSVGSGRTAADDVPALLAQRERGLLPPPAPAHGLTLETVYYRRGWEGAYDHPLHGSELCEAEGGGVDEACLAACLLDEECTLD